jgi:hypothetical protein
MLDAMVHTAIACQLQRPNKVSPDTYAARIRVIEYLAWRLRAMGVRGSVRQITAKWMGYYVNAIFQDPDMN